MSIIAFADDVILLAAAKTKLDNCVKSLEDESNKISLSKNFKKSKYTNIKWENKRETELNSRLKSLRTLPYIESERSLSLSSNLCSTWCNKRQNNMFNQDW